MAGLTEVDVPVKQLSDEDMLSIMIHENATVYGHGTATNNHAVAQACRFLTRELLLAEALGGWETIRSGEFSRPNAIAGLFDSEPAYRSAFGLLHTGVL